MSVDPRFIQALLDDEAVAGSVTTVAAGESSAGDESAGTGAVCLACVLSAVWTWVSGASAAVARR